MSITYFSKIIEAQLDEIHICFKALIIKVSWHGTTENTKTIQLTSIDTLRDIFVMLTKTFHLKVIV